MPLSDPEFRTDIERMLVCHSWARKKYLNLFARLPWRVLTRRRGSSFETIRDVHLHVLRLYSWWLVNFFGQRQLAWVLKRRGAVKSVQELRELNRAVDVTAQRAVRQLRPADFDRKMRPPPRPGHEAAVRKYRITPGEVPWHLIEEDFLHHGEILCMLWQDDIESPYTGVWWFEGDRAPERHRDLWYAEPRFPRLSEGGYVKEKPQRRTERPQRSRRRS